MTSDEEAAMVQRIQELDVAGRHDDADALEALLWMIREHND